METNEKQGWQLVRRNRIPESFLFGPDYAYTGFTFNGSSGKIQVASATVAVHRLRESFCNVMVITQTDCGVGTTSVDQFIVRLITRENQTGFAETDILIPVSTGAVLVVPLFCNVYAVAVMYGVAAPAYATDPSEITGIIFA